MNRSITAQSRNVESRTVRPGAPIAYAHSMWMPGVSSTASWKRTFSMVWFAPVMSMPFSSTTFPTAAFLNVAPDPRSSTAAMFGRTPPASTSTPSNVTLLASLISWRSRTPGPPLNVTGFSSSTSVCVSYQPGPMRTTPPFSASA